MSKRISCDNCGLCCLHMRTPPFIPGEGRWAQLSQRLKDEVERHALRKTPQSRRLDTLGMKESAPCLWYDMRTMRCREYKWRPRTCRDFVVGEDPCLDFRCSAGVLTPLEMADG